MGDEMQLADMTPRGRLVAEVFDCRGEDFPSDYLEASGHLDPGIAVRLHDTCAALYDGRWSVEQAYDAWDECESVLKGFAEGYGLDSLYELMAIADPLTPEEREPAMPLGPLDREALSQAMDWLKAYIGATRATTLRKDSATTRSPSPSSLWTGTERPVAGTCPPAKTNFVKQRSWTG